VYAAPADDRAATGPRPVAGDAAAGDDGVSGAAPAGGDRHEAVSEETVTFRLPSQMSGEEAERIAAGEGADGNPAGTGAADPYAIGPERHERADDQARIPQTQTQPAADAQPAAPTASAPATPADAQPATPADAQPSAPAEQPEPVTDKGLPKRTPKVVSAPAPRPRTGAVDAEALRRRLGGFHTGSRAGRRDVEAELAATGGPGAQGAPGPQGEGRDAAAGTPRPRQGNASEQATGGTVEEASS
jgi:hypothetical protein